MNAMFSLADLPSHSLRYLYDWESNREQFFYLPGARDIGSKSSENRMNLLLASQVLMMNSKARSTALHSAVKTDESSGLHNLLIWLPVI